MTHLILPGWWVRAYEAAALFESGGDGAMAQACAAGLAPALSGVELNALAMVLGSLQTQILAGRASQLVINSEEHLKHAGTAARGRRFTFEKVVQMLTGLRLLREAGDGTLHSEAPFTADRWTRRPGGEFEIELSLAPLGPELLLGVSDAHADLVRYARGELEAADALGEQAPLTVWRSAWLELGGPEQLLLLRIERSMQWEFRWLQLDGIFGLALGELFSGLRLPETRGTPEPELARRLKLLARLGKKLAGHGFLAPSVADQYLAVDDDTERGGLTLIWQAGRERLGSDAAAVFHATAAAFMLRHRYTDSAVEALARLCLAPGAPAEALGKARALWEQLAAAPAVASLSGVNCRPCQPVLPQALFFEYCLRAQPDARFPLPDSLRVGPLAELIRGGDAADAGARFQHFCAAVDADGEFPRALREVPFATLASAATRRDRNFRAAVSELLTATAGYELQASDQPKPRLVAPSAPLSAPSPSPLASPASSPLLPEPSPPPPTSAPPRRQGAVSGALASRMLKIASDELAKMRAGDLTRYQDLKHLYLESLDEAGRKLMLDVQKRIQPSMFEEQLRQRLVRFMVDNPGAWRSAEGAKAGGP